MKSMDNNDNGKCNLANKYGNINIILSQFARVIGGEILSCIAKIVTYLYIIKWCVRIQYSNQAEGGKSLY